MANTQPGIFASRRSVVHSTKGIVASTQPLANQAGIEILRRGGNAADAAVAVAAALNVTEPGMTGIGGDMFCLFYDARTRAVHALNGSGRSGSKLTLGFLRKELGLSDGQGSIMPMGCVHAVTVPGAAAGWVDCVEHFGSGKVALSDILAPAIELAEEGFPVSEFSAIYWKAGEDMLKKASPNGAEMLKPDRTASNGCRAPRVGEIMRLPQLAKTFRTLAEKGKKGFYEGYIADAIIEVVSDLGGVLCHDDLKHHCEVGSELDKPISLNFRGQGLTETYENGLEIWEHPPNGQGLVALMALGILQELERMGKIPRFDKSQHNSAEYLHAVVEVLRIAFADGNWWIADPASGTANNGKVASLLSPTYLSERAKLFDPKHAISADQLSHGNPYSDSFANTSPAHRSGDTVYFAITDSAGNAMSFINSNFGGFSTPENPAGNGFGSCIVPKGCGFVLQNRGAKFALHPPEHPNILAPRKRPYHTIIPGMVTEPAERRCWNSDESEKTEKVRSAKRAKKERCTSKTSSPVKVPFESNVTGPLHSTFGIMGGYMQPQGQVQLLLNQFIFQHDPQTALDAPRICVGAPMPDSGGKGSIDITHGKKGDEDGAGSNDRKNNNNNNNNNDDDDSTAPIIYIEHGIAEHVVLKLKEMGHANVRLVGRRDDDDDWPARSVFGRGQIVRCRRLDEYEYEYEYEEDDDGDDEEDFDFDDTSMSTSTSINENKNTKADTVAATPHHTNMEKAMRKRKRESSSSTPNANPSRSPSRSPSLSPSHMANPPPPTTSPSIFLHRQAKKEQKGQKGEKERKKIFVYSAGSDPRGDGAAVPL